MKTHLFLVILLSVFSLSASAQETLSLDQLLDNVKEGHVRDKLQQKKREKQFKANQEQQAEALSRIKQERKEEEQRSTRLEKQFDENDQSITELRQQLDEELGNLKELLGSLQQTAAEAKVSIEASVISAQYPGRAEQLEQVAQKIGQSSELVSLDEIEGVWFQLLQEMTEQGKVQQFSAPVINAAGETETTTVTRVGVFNVIAHGKFLHYNPATGLSELPRQPQSRYLAQASELENSGTGLVTFSIDPTQGQLLSALVDSPSIMERIYQGGIVGYLIITMGVVGLFVGLIKILLLWMTETKVNKQKKQLSSVQTNNPLGRILTVYHQHPQSDLESMELRLGEAIMKETPKLHAWIMVVKIIAVVAPLMGLLGTVTGMIQTFQSITLFGAGDPKLMAGGISQALVTTVLGLCAAIPMVLLHTAASSRAKRIQEVLEEQSTGMIARQAEASTQQTVS